MAKVRMILRISKYFMSLCVISANVLSHDCFKSRYLFSLFIHNFHGRWVGIRLKTARGRMDLVPD